MLTFLLACAHLNPIAIVKAGGYIGLGILVFAESGLFIGILLPGDSLLFAAGLLSAGGFLGPWSLSVVVIIAAVLGDTVGYWFGANVGNNLFKRKDSRFFRREYIARTKEFYKAYGRRAVVLARFVPIVRTIAPMFAGAGKMPYARFALYNALGACVWGAGMIFLGFSVGAVVPGSEAYVLPISAVIVVISFFPALATMMKHGTLA